MHLATYVQMLKQGSRELASAYRVVARGHDQKPEIVSTTPRFASPCDAHVDRLGAARSRCGDHPAGPQERLHLPALTDVRTGGLGLVRDLHELYDDRRPASRPGLLDEALVSVARDCHRDMTDQLSWLLTQVKTGSPQALIAAE